MGSGKKVSEDEYRTIKSWLRWSKPQNVAQKAKRHIAIVLKVQAAKDYEMYQKISKAEHPPIKNSLADRIKDLEDWKHNIVEPHLSHCEGRTQIEGIGDGKPEVI